MLDPPTRLLFLPGASGDTAHWRPVAERLQHCAEQIHLGWPGFGETPPDPAVRGFDDLRKLVLAVTSGGLPMAEHGAEDWREAFCLAHPRLPDWFATASVDLSDRLSSVASPVLPLWGDADPISPVSVGQALASLLPVSQLVVIPGGTHDLAVEHADVIAPPIDRHLSRPSSLNAP